MICFENVSFQYESERHPALREFTHSIAKGELVLLLGPSGCGKTTITRLLNGLVPHFYEGELKGIVRIGGRTTTETTIQSLADIVGSVFQDPRSQFFATDCNIRNCIFLRERRITKKRNSSQSRECLKETGH